MVLQKFVTNIEEIRYWFNQFQIESIELHINGVETGGITRLFVSAKGEGGITIILMTKQPK